MISFIIKILTFIPSLFGFFKEQGEIKQGEQTQALKNTQAVIGDIQDAKRIQQKDKKLTDKQLDNSLSQ